MAAAQAQLNNAFQNQTQLSTPQYDQSNPLFTDIPTQDGMVKLKTMGNLLSKLVRAQHDLYSAVITQVAPGAPNAPGGAPNQIVQQEDALRNRVAAEYIVRSYQ